LAFTDSPKFDFRRLVI
jgi:hypothetical protein